MVILVLYQSALIYGAAVGLLALGFRLIQESSNYINVGHSVNIGVGMAFGFIIIQQLNLVPILGAPFSFILTGLFNVIVYLVFYRRMEKHNYPEEMIALFGIVSIYIAENALTVIEYLLRLNFPSDLWCGPAPTRFSSQHLHYRASSTGIFMGGLPEILLIFTGIVLLYRWIYYSNHGALLRAVGENSSLVEVSGISFVRVKVYAWFIAGGLAGIAGVILPYIFKGEMGRDIQLFAPMMAAAFMVENRASWEAGLSGLLVGFLSQVLRAWMVSSIGLWTAEYWNTVPLLILITVLIVKDRRIVLPNWLRPRRLLSSLGQQ